MPRNVLNCDMANCFSQQLVPSFQETYNKRGIRCNIQEKITQTSKKLPTFSSFSECCFLMPIKVLSHFAAIMCTSACGDSNLP